MINFIFSPNRVLISIALAFCEQSFAFYTSPGSPQWKTDTPLLVALNKQESELVDRIVKERGAAWEGDGREGESQYEGADDTEWDNFLSQNLDEDPAGGEDAGESVDGDSRNLASSPQSEEVPSPDIMEEKNNELDTESENIQNQAPPTSVTERAGQVQQVPVLPEEILEPPVEPNLAAEGPGQTEPETAAAKADADPVRPADASVAKKDFEKAEGPLGDSKNKASLSMEESAKSTQTLKKPAVKPNPVEHPKLSKPSLKAEVGVPKKSSVTKANIGQPKPAESGFSGSKGAKKMTAGPKKKPGKSGKQNSDLLDIDDPIEEKPPKQALQKKTKRKSPITRKNRSAARVKKQRSRKNDPARELFFKNLKVLEGKPSRFGRRSGYAQDTLRKKRRLSSASLWMLSLAYGKNKDRANQIMALDKLINRNPKEGKYVLAKAKASISYYFETGDPEFREQAYRLIEEVLTLNKKHHEAAHLQTLRLLKFKDDEENNYYAILEHLKTMARLYGLKKAYIKEVCKYNYLNNFYKESKNVCKRAIKHFPKEPGNYVYYTLSLKDPLVIKPKLKKIAKRFSKSVFVQSQVGEYFLKLGDYENSLKYYMNAARANPGSAPVQIGLAQSLFYTGNEGSSYKAYYRACVLDKGKMIWAFKEAKSRLNQKNKFRLASRFENGITQCMHNTDS